MHPAKREGLRLLYLPQQVSHSGQHPARPGCGRNGTCWQFQKAEEAHTHTHTQSFQKKLCLSQPLIKFSESNIFWKGLLLLSLEVDI